MRYKRPPRSDPFAEAHHCPNLRKDSPPTEMKRTLIRFLSAAQIDALVYELYGLME
jgi:hypothetical protein